LEKMTSIHRSASCMQMQEICLSRSARLQTIEQPMS